eukprot:TRINITY_DN1844_c0_g3_i1.p1 TRINITY_DN1844_c0_g3~~TRINITY_DN1844_c0_g3_i1.p1  ORF type:complete len:363 (-),score=97.79 TRINITY_DN1844_c0_g3_i1:238-1326(-)
MHQSGIRVGDDLKKEFVACEKDESTVFIQIKIVNDKFTKVATGSRTSEMKSDFEAVQKVLKTSEATYVAMRAPKKPGMWLLVYYVPDDAIVRDKMLYASSSSSLKEGLGGAKFVTDYSISTPSECTLGCYENSTKEIKKSDLMTAEEQVKQDEIISSELAKTSVKTSAMADLQTEVADEVKKALKSVKDGEINTVFLNIDSKTEKIKVESSGKLSLEEVAKKMPDKEPRFAVHVFPHEHSSKQAIANMFIYCCPDLCPPRQKMTYSTFKKNAVKLCETSGLDVKCYECGNGSEINASNLLYILYPHVEEKKLISKPKTQGKKPTKLFAVKFNADSVSSPLSASSPTSTTSVTPSPSPPASTS